MKVSIRVPDMTCNHCKMTLEKSVGAVENVQKVNVNLADHIVEVNGDVEVEDVVSAITEAGYTAKEILNIQ